MSVSLLPGWQTDMAPGSPRISFDLAPDWKTYWRSPGDTGIPPLFDWSGSENLRVGPLCTGRARMCFRSTGCRASATRTNLCCRSN